MWADVTTRDERRIRAFVEAIPALSETVVSLSSKLQVNRRVCRSVLEKLVDEGSVRRRDFRDIEPIYYRAHRD
jgi:ribosomal protein S25